MELQQEKFEALNDIEKNQGKIAKLGTENK